MKTIDLRSDTVTLPTREMLELIVETPLGDDVYGEDPTVNRLQEMAAAKLGKDRALFVTSGTQGNLISTLSQTSPGDGVIVESRAHIYINELGGMAVIGGLLAQPVPGRKGVLLPDDVAAAVRLRNLHTPGTALICVEDTHNDAGGVCWKLKELEAIRELADKRSLRVHMDGARIFNAAVALGVDVKEISKYTDSVTFCLSKGLCAPVGSLVVGEDDFIERALRWRKMLGGGMRQAGVLAAPGIVALTKMVNRLRDDHANARVLAEGLSQIRGISIDLDTVQTNIVRFDLAGTGMDAKIFSEKLAEKGIQATGSGTRMRMVTHYYVSREDIVRTLEESRGIIS